MPIPSYPSIYALGHKAIAEIFNGPVTIEEKVDGSQISFGVFEGELHVRSRRADIDLEDAQMFGTAVEQIKERLRGLRPDVVYRGEYLQRPKHNTLCYDRVPVGNIVLFDIEMVPGGQLYLDYAAKAELARNLDWECVPRLHEGKVDSFDELMALLDRESFLGGPKVEGFVVKNYELFTVEKKIAIGKYVSEAFKEKHRDDWKERNPSRADVVARLIHTYKTEARWRKAIQHLREQGVLEGSPRDIGPLMREVATDVRTEEADDIGRILVDHFWRDISRGLTAGLPEWYKQQLAEQAFDSIEASA